MHPDVWEKRNNSFRKASALIEVNESGVEDVLDQLRRSPVGLDETLEQGSEMPGCISSCWVNFDERDIIEGAFRRGI